MIAPDILKTDNFLLISIRQLGKLADNIRTGHQRTDRKPKRVGVEISEKRYSFVFSVNTNGFIVFQNFGGRIFNGYYFYFVTLKKWDYWENKFRRAGRVNNDENFFHCFLCFLIIYQNFKSIALLFCLFT